MTFDHKPCRRPAVLAIFAILCFAPAIVSAQQIDGLSGDPSHGHSLIISGSAFGTKASPAPVQWSDFEGRTEGSNVTTSDGWNSVSSPAPTYSSDAVHSGSQGIVCAFVDGTYNVSMRKDANYSTGFYLDAWIRYIPANPASRNYKVFMLFGTGVNEYPATALTGFCDLSGSVEFPFYAGPGAGDADWTGLAFNDLMGEMKHLQVWLEPSTPGVHDGKTWGAVNGDVFANSNDKLTVMPDVGYWHQARIGYYMGHDASGGCAASGDGWVYWDDVYIDNTQARVEIGNNSNYDLCTHREIQIPTDWSSGTVTVDFNQGGFAPGDDVYVFVTTADGARTPGYPVTIGQSDLVGPGRPGKPVF